MRRRNLALALAGAVLLAFVAVGVRFRNDLVANEVSIDTQWKQVEVQLVRQHELLPKLVSVVQRYAEHEGEVYGALAEARSGYARAGERARPEKASDVDGALTRLLALVESYPRLQSDQQFRDLSYEIAGTKNRIATERRRYNELVGHFNMRIRQVPWRLAAFGLEPREYYAASDESMTEPEISFR
jgi:LemA protein